MTEKELSLFKKTVDFMQTIQNRMVEELKVILLGNFGLYDSSSVGQVKFLDFEIEMEGYSVNLYPSDKDLSQLGFKETLPEFPDGFVRSNDLRLDIADYDFDNDADLLRLDEYYEKLETEFIKWFAECWDEAGGAESQYPFYIAPHDSNKAFDLREKRWIDNDIRFK